ncbi:hypothetical protein L1887_05746 [Cichorium endivia]|nr:hypothetical protein L1887_05746 [Cichorium endivia]
MKEARCSLLEGPKSDVDLVIEFGDGVLVKCSIFGLVEVNSHLSNTADLTLSFANPSILNDVHFHPCVRFRPWESEQIPFFVPPDGLFKLMSYSLETDYDEKWKPLVLKLGSMEHSYSYSSGYNGTDQASGAYIFRPNATFPKKSLRADDFAIVRGPLMDEVHQQLNSCIYQVTRVYNKCRASGLEMEMLRRRKNSFLS